MKSDPFRLSEVARQPLTLIELLRWRVQHQPDQQVYTFLDADETKKVSLTYRELDQRACAIAARLQSISARGERALLLYPPGLEFIAAFFGCLYAGVIAVPAYPPRLNRNLLRVQAIIADATATVTMTTAAILSKVKRMMDHVPDLKQMRWLDTESIEGGLDGVWKEPEIDLEDLAFLQYTSGSTGSPKGVMLTHGNLLHNASLVYRALDHVPTDKYISWLPTFHDMGFMAGVLQPLYGGFPVVLMSPTAFLQSPIRWLQAITDYRGTTSGAPNFAYDLCVRKIPPAQRETLDLSSWTAACNGAEPIRHETLERFVAAFEPYGFRREVFYPCYGLAEATLIVSGGRKSEPPVVKTFQAGALGNNRIAEIDSRNDENARTLVGCGNALFEQQVVIVNPESVLRCAPDEVGEIWVSGPSVAQGYWNRPEQTEQTFRAHLADTGEGPFLRTEDLGFLRDGELFVAGRIKDLVIIRGRNHYPQDIELTVERSHPALRAGCGAAFSVDVDDEERLAVVQEIENLSQANTETVIEAIRRAVAEEHELQVYAVVLIKPGSVPKTSSGKIQRHACRNDFLSGELKTIESSVLSASEAEPNRLSLTREELIGAPPASRQALLESYLQEQVSRVLKVRPSQISSQLPLNTLGIDSLMSIELQYNIESTFGVSMPMASFLQEANLVSLAAQILSQLTASSEPPQLMAQAGEGGTSESHSASYPLSYGQQSLWFLYHLAPESAAYNIARAVRILSPLNVRAFRSAFQQLVDRHPSLRTTFPASQESPLQWVHPSSEVSFQEEDAAAWTEERLKEDLEAEARRPFDLENGPLFRVVLYTRSQREHVLLLAMHHIVADFWSLVVLMNELGILFQAQKTGAQAALQPPATSYADYVRWQAELVDGPAGERLWAYWQKQLADELPALDLPTDRPRPAVQTYLGSSQSILLSKQLTEALKRLSRARGATLYMTLLAAFQVLLHRYTGEEEIIVGSSTTGRSRNELAGVVGYFVNPIVLRANLSGDPTCEEFLDHVRQLVLAAFEHQDYPFALLVERLQPKRDPSRSPLFQVMFVLQKAQLLNEEGLASFALGEEGARMALGDLEFASVSLEQRVAQFDLTLMMAEAGEGLAASLEYNADLFDGATITRMLEHFETLLESLAAHPEQKLSGLSLLTAAERHQLLVQWNDTRTEYPRQRLIHELIEEQAASSPDALAVSYGERQLTYRELNQQSNQLGRHLQSLGVRPETRVGIMMERAPEMVLALLAVLKAGAAYVPLDPAYPQERLAFMLEDAQVAVLLTHSRLTHILPESEVTVLCLDQLQDELLAADDTLQPTLAALVSEDNLAYVIYTSGSTGRPKGVAITHRSAVTLLYWAQQTWSKTELTGVLASTSICFDLSVFELFLPLSVGGQIILAENALQLPTLAAADEVTLINTVPSAMTELVRSGALPPSVQVVNLAGEPLKQQLVQQVYEQRGVARVFNLYGPSEDTTYSTFALMERGSSSAPSIGRPIANTQAYLLDANLEPVPQGIIAELYLGGEGLARGYLNRAELTAEKFIPDPFGGVAGGRLYKTGDLGRYLPNGELEFLGRIDHQVKVRGFRIELGEVEARLVEQPGVREAVVVAREDAGGEQRLVGYVACAKGGTPSQSELRKRLREKLPEYMVPSAIVLMEELPLTPNGKIDRKALPEVEATRPEMRQEYVGAKTEIEEILCGIWERVLGVERVGIHDNFFDLGGDSILSIQLINRVRQAGIFLTPRQLFQHQTVAQLAAVATAQRPHQTAESDQSEQLPVIGSLLLTPVQRWFFEHDLPNPHHWNQAILLQARQPLDHSLLERALQELISHHDALRLRFTRQGSDWQQFSADTSEQVSCRALDLSALPVEEQRRVIEAEATALQSSLDISQGPLYRAAYFYSGDEHPDRLLLVIHHLAVDAVSWRILLEDLETAYRQLSLGEAVRLPPKTISFKQWAERLAEYARSPELEREAAYWLSDREEKSSRLPVDLDGGPNTEASTQTVSVSLNEEETHSLLHEVPAAYLARINEVLLSALAQTLSRWAGGALPVDIEGHGREEVFEGRDTSRTVGWFTSIFPVMLEAVSEEEASANASLKRVKEQLRRIPQKGIGYGVLRYLRGDASLREQLRSRPHPEVSFNYLGQLDQVFSRSRLFKQTTQEIGPTHDPQGRRRYLLEINGSVINGQLQLNWTYSENLHRRDTIEKLALEFTAALKSLIATCASGEADCHTPSDFPLARLDQLTLDQLVQEYGQLENIYPLSPIQRGMLFHSLYAPASGVYVEQLSLTLRGNLDIAAFERAWQQAAQRHATLRTAFVWENLDEPLQLVQRKVGLSWEREDWREFSTDEQQDRLAAYLRTDRSRGFELSEAPLMRMWLSRLTDETYQLVWSYHHLLLDGWSLPIILEEVLSFYETSRQDRELRLDSGQPYLDYINWLRQQDLSEAEAFWRKSLEGFHAPTPIGVDSVARSSTAMEGDHAEQQTRLTLSKTAQLQSFARQHQLTLNTLLQGAWALLLSRYSGERDVVFGATVSGRSAELTGAERMVGPFINTVPVRVRTPARARTLNWLRELQGQQAELRNYEYTPLVQIQGWSEVPRSRPLFESIFVFENYPVDASLRDLQGSLRIDKIDFFEQTNYPLAVMAVPGPELLLKVMYDRQRFDDATVSRMLSHFENLLTGIRANPDQPISQLPLLSAHELTRLLTEWNDTQVEYARDKCIHELIEAQAASTPEAVALVFEKEKLSYRELNERANQLAHHLRQQGVGPESLVGVLMERSVEQVVALLGVLKAGGAYVPLDPAYPRERLAYMLADARVEVLLTQEGLGGVLPPTPARAIYLDTAWRQIAKASTENPAGVVTADNLAYIIYTSGSTGRPKGVMVPHRALGNHMAWMAGRFPLGAADRVLQKTPFSFDASVWEFYAPLLAGAQLVLAEPGGHADPAYLVKLIVEQEVTTLQLVPTLLERLLEEAGMAECVSLKRVFCGGEALSVRVAERFREKLGAEFYNLYGPTEATIDATYWKYEVGVAGSSIPIGRPVANTQIYLLDRHVHPVPEGVPGELHIGGVQLARGYHGRPELTAEKFIPDPFGGVAGGRLYKTGDLGRYLPNGELEFLGRIDHQVKVRGFRIELGEVEARLVEQPGVREAVVVAREDAGGEQRLVGYVACAKGETPSQSELRKRLREKLPEYMVPSAIVLMEELPLTPNGKIDRKALPAPEGLRPELTEDLVLPRTPLEGVLASIWRDVLGLEEVGVHDNFFELGGHSLLAMQLLSRLRRVLKVDLPLRDLMSTATIAEVARLLTAREAALGQVERLDYLAESLDEAGAGHLRAGVIPPRQADEELPLSFAQQRLWFLSQLQPEVALYNCPAAVRLKGRLNAEALVRALSEIIRRHEILRTNFPATENGNPVQRILQARPLIPQVVDLRTFPTSEREDEARRLLVEEARKPFDLTQDQLLRVTLLNLDQEDSVLMLTAHHINVDAWSMGVLVGELATLYQAFSTNNPSPLPELPIQYADFALWQRQWLQGEVLAEQSRYWKRVLGGQLPVLELPVGRPRARQRTHHGERRIFLIDQELAAALNSLSRLEGVTLYMTLLAAFQTLLHRYTKQDDIIVGTAIANRPLDELEGLIGCFINTLALRTDFSGGPGFQEVLRQVRELSLGALSHQDMPFDKLVYELQPERSLSETPIVQVAFGIQNSPMPALELTGLKLTPIEVDDGIARLDLTLWIEESAGGLKAAWTYSTDLFDAQAIKRMHRHYETLLRSIVAHPETRVDALDMLTEAEKEQVEAQGKRREESNYQRLLKVRPKSVSTPQEIVKD